MSFNHLLSGSYDTKPREPNILKSHSFHPQSECLKWGGEGGGSKQRVTVDDGEASRRIQHVRSDLKCQVSAQASKPCTARPETAHVEVRERDAHCRCVTAEARGRERIQLTWRLLFPTPIAENGCRARVSRRRSRECWRPAVSLVRGGAVAQGLSRANGAAPGAAP